jgi:hypothetical protein
MDRLNLEWLEENFSLTDCETERWLKNVKDAIRDEQESNDYE